ncbi:MAG TPA: hypothetical protein VJ377_05585, partial [Dehalococcoidales bacterium]|nr:hypothetical protein [Dehalococcoidales bacterium]
MFIVGLILPYANVNISQSIARIFLFIGFVLIVLSFVAGILRFFLINQNMSSDTRDKYSTLYDIIPILRKMDRHLWGIAERQKIVNINIYKFNRTASKINELMDVKTGTLDPKKLMEGWLEDTKKIMASEKKQVQILIRNSDLGQSDRLMVSITRLLDSDGYGLIEDKESDKKYSRYRKSIEKYFDANRELVDSWLSYLINYHIHMSEYFANSLLVIKRTDLITAKARIPMFGELAGAETQANLADLKNDTNERLIEIRTIITDYIRE